jgi:hypothetical protein
MNQSALSFSVEDYIRLVEPNIAPALISGSALRDVRAVSRLFPGLLTAFNGFECRLNVEEPRADFLLCAKPEEFGRSILSGKISAPALPESFFTMSAWARVRAFCRAWEQPSSALHDEVANVWLEFDVAENPALPPVPSFFFGSESIIAARGRTGNAWVTQDALAVVLGKELEPEVNDRLHACIEALPVGAHVFQVGCMLSRPSSAVRLCLRGFRPGEIVPYLERVGWPGESRDLALLVADLGRRVERVDLDIDVGRTVQPKVGLECYLNRQPKFESRWRSFFDCLIEKKCCLPAKAEGLLAYPGFARCQAGGAPWPDYLEKTAALLGRHVMSVIFRTVHHVKVVFSPGRPLEAKAYLAIYHNWLDGQAVKAALAAPGNAKNTPCEMSMI